MTTRRIVHSRTAKASDIDIRVSTLITDGGLRFTEVREYIISLDQYGRGITFHTDLSPEILDGLTGSIYYQAENPS